MHKVPYMLIVGEKEQSAQSVSVRKHKEGDLGLTALGEFTERITRESREKSL
jgi:threonyl-tRNA synthetase